MSVEVTDQEAQAVAVAPRVKLSDIETAIQKRYDLNGAEACHPGAAQSGDPLNLLSVCVLVMKNGFTIIGKSAPASPENFNADLGKKFAYEDAIRQLWPLMGYALRDKLANGGL